MLFVCSRCGSEVDLTNRSYRRNVRKNGHFICSSCISKSKDYSFVAERNKDPEFRKKISESKKKYWNSDKGKQHKERMRSDEYKQRLSDQAKHAWEDQQYRKLKSIQSKELINDPKFIDMLRQSSINLWESDNYVEKHHSAMNAIKHRLSELSKSRWKDPNYRDKTIKAINENWRDSDFRDRWYARITSEEVRSKIAESRQNNAVSMGLSFSKPHRIVREIIKELGVEFIEEYKIGHYNFDLFLPDLDILIEINGDYWHNLPKTIIKNRSKSTYIYKYFPHLKLVTIWEHETMSSNVIERICELIGITKPNVKNFDFNDIRIDDIAFSDADMFLSKYHYLRGVGKRGKLIGAFLNNKLVAVFCYGSVTRKETASRFNLSTKDVRELTRFCIHPYYHKKNFSSWFLSRCVNRIQGIKLLVTFADSTYGHSGIIYKASNWIFDGVVSPSYWYVSQDRYVMHKKTLWDHAKSLGMTETEFANKNGYSKIFGSKKYRYIYWLQI